MFSLKCEFSYYLFQKCAKKKIDSFKMLNYFLSINVFTNFDIFILIVNSALNNSVSV